MSRVSTEGLDTVFRFGLDDRSFRADHRRMLHDSDRATGRWGDQQARTFALLAERSARATRQLYSDVQRMTIERMRLSGRAHEAEIAQIRLEASERRKAIRGNADLTPEQRERGVAEVRRLEAERIRAAVRAERERTQAVADRLIAERDAETARADAEAAAERDERRRAAFAREDREFRLEALRIQELRAGGLEVEADRERVLLDFRRQRAELERDPDLDPAQRAAMVRQLYRTEQAELERINRLERERLLTRRASARTGIGRLGGILGNRVGAQMGVGGLGTLARLGPAGAAAAGGLAIFGVARRERQALDEYAQQFPGLVRSLDETRERKERLRLEMGRDAAVRNQIGLFGRLREQVRGVSDALRGVGRDARDAWTDLTSGTPGAAATERANLIAAENRIRRQQQADTARPFADSLRSRELELGGRGFDAERFRAGADFRAQRRALVDQVGFSSPEFGPLVAALERVYEATLKDIDARERAERSAAGTERAQRRDRAAEMDAEARRQAGALLEGLAEDATRAGLQERGDAAGLGVFDARARARDRRRALAEQDGLTTAEREAGERSIAEAEASEIRAATEAEADRRRDRRESLADDAESLRIQRLRAAGQQLEAERASIALDFAQRRRQVERDTLLTVEERAAAIAALNETEAALVDAAGRTNRSGRGRVAIESGVGVTAALRAQTSASAAGPRSDPVTRNTAETNRLLRRIEQRLDRTGVTG